MTDGPAIAAYPVDSYPGCPCFRCDSPTWQGGYPWALRMSMCPSCGATLCPGAQDHRKHVAHDPLADNA